MGDVVEHLLEELADVIVVKRVDDVPATPAGRDEREMAKKPQVVGDRALLQAERLDELPDRAGRSSKTIEDPDPRG